MIITVNIKRIQRLCKVFHLPASCRNPGVYAYGFYPTGEIDLASVFPVMRTGLRNGFVSALEREPPLWYRMSTQEFLTADVSYRTVGGSCPGRVQSGIRSA